MRVISQDTGEQRFWVGDHAKTRTCAALIAEHVSTGSTPLYTDEWQSYRGVIRPIPPSATVAAEWAREADGDDRRAGPRQLL
jgi:hypothetical protein